MDSFAALKRRTTDLLLNVQQNLPSMPSVTSPRKGRDGIHGTWEPLSLPSVPRSSHSLNIVSGTAYIFGGEINPREPVDNDMHVVTLPWSEGSGADYYKIKAAASKRDDPTPEVKTVLPEPGKKEKEQESSDEEESEEEESEEEESEDEDDDESDGKTEEELNDVPLTPAGAKGKGKEPAGPEPVILGDVPAPRVGHATAVIGSRIFLFGGRGGPQMVPLEEAGRVWVFDTRTNTWSYLDPVSAVKGGTIVPHPAPRSYHCATSTEHPRDFPAARPKKAEGWQEWALGDTSKTGIPQAPIVGNVAEEAIDQEADGYGTFFVHGGCLTGGDRSNDIWAFDVHTRTWTELPAAPGPGRGGSAICISKSRLFRFGGFDGKTEIGGQIDFLHLESEMFDDKTGKGEVGIRARGSWQTILENNVDASSTEFPLEPSQKWPAPRSVASLEAITIGGGSEYLVLAMGEGNPSSQGHAGAGKFFDDVWMFQVPPLGMSAASVTAAVMQAVGRKTGEGKWTKVELSPHDEDNDDTLPAPRGWLATAPMGDLAENAIFVWGGLGEDNQRLGDGWILRLGETGW